MVEGAASKRINIKTLTMLVPESVVQEDAEKKRVKKGLLGGSEERFVFGTTLYLPYLEFSYQYPIVKGVFTKQTVLAQGRSAVMALREVNLGFYPELVSLTSQLTEEEADYNSVVPGVDSTTLVREG